jgi:hypothetical protein
VDPDAWIARATAGPAPDGWREDVDPAAAEAALLDRLREEQPAWGAAVVVDDLRIEGVRPDSAVVVEFRAPRRYGDARYVLRWRLWDDGDRWDTGILLANLYELAEAADIELEPGGPDRLTPAVAPADLIRAVQHGEGAQALHPYVRWVRADGTLVRGRRKVLELLDREGRPRDPASVELRDGQLLRWVER